MEHLSMVVFNLPTLPHLHILQYSAGLSMEQYGTLSTRRLRLKYVQLSMRRCVILRHRDYANLPQDRSVPLYMRRHVRRCTRACVWSSTRRSTSRTPRLSVAPSTRRTVNISGRVMVTIRYGLLLLVHVKTTHTRHVRM